MITGDQITTIGKFNKPHGINGEISATIQVPLEVLEGCSCIVCDIDGINVPFFVKQMRSKSHETVLLTIDDITSEQEAAMLVNKEINVMRDEYSKLVAGEDELPVDFFIGFDAVINGNRRGTIADIDDSTANVLFVVDMESGEQVLIPAVEDFIEDIDIDGKRMELDVPQEILDL